MKQYGGYLIDLDGTMYKGEEEIEAAPRFIHALKERNIPYLFLTNNASLTQKTIAEKLNGFGIPAVPEDVFSTALATAKYISEQKSDARCFIVGENGLLEAIEQNGLQIVDEDADYVVMGLDRKVNYDKLAAACLQIRAGARFISTNSDMAIPREKGLYPGNGAITTAVEASTGVKATYIGKPETIIMEEAVRLLGKKKEQILMVGDNYKTDIQAGINTSLDTLMVFTGVSKREDLADLPTQPTYHENNLDNWIAKLT